MENIKRIYAKYISDCNFVYSSYQDNKIIIFKKTILIEPIDMSVINKFLLHKGHSLIMCVVFYKLEPEKTIDCKDVIVNNVSYYNAIEPAFYYNLCIDNYSGSYVKFDGASGKLICRGEYQNGNKTGLWTFWHKNGQKSEEGYFTNNHKTQLWMCWSEDGEKILKITI